MVWLSSVWFADYLSPLFFLSKIEWLEDDCLAENICVGRENICVERENICVGRENICVGRENICVGRENICVGRENICAPVINMSEKFHRM